MGVDQGELERLRSAVRLAGAALKAAPWHAAAATARGGVYSGHFRGQPVLVPAAGRTARTINASTVPDEPDEYPSA